MKIMTFDEWVVEKLSSVSPKDSVSCPECGGEGGVECDCCGHEHDCKLCNGYGFVDFEKVKKQDQNKCFNINVYKSDVAADIEQMSNWFGLPVRKTLHKAGISFKWFTRLYLNGSREIIQVKIGNDFLEFHAEKLGVV